MHFATRGVTRNLFKDAAGFTKTLEITVLHPCATFEVRMKLETTINVPKQGYHSAAQLVQLMSAQHIMGRKEHMQQHAYSSVRIDCTTEFVRRHDPAQPHTVVATRGVALGQSRVMQQQKEQRNLCKNRNTRRQLRKAFVMI